MLRRRHGRAAVATFCVLTASMTGLVVSPASAAASVSTDQADMAKLEQNHYVGAVNTKLNDALTSLQMDQARTRDAQSGLRSEQAQAQETLRQLSAAHDAATAAIADDEAKLTSIRGDLRTVLAAISNRRHAAEVAAE